MNLRKYKQYEIGKKLQSRNMSLVEIVKYFMTKHSKTESSDFDQLYEVISSIDDEDCTPRSPREQALKVYRVSLKTIRNDKAL